MTWTARELCAAIERQGFPDQPITFIDMDGRELPFRWMYGERDEDPSITGVTIRLNVEGGTVLE